MAAAAVRRVSAGLQRRGLSAVESKLPENVMTIPEMSFIVPGLSKVHLILSPIG
jgi:hypothetical protein